MSYNPTEVGCDVDAYLLLLSMLTHSKTTKNPAFTDKTAYVVDDHPLVARGIAEFLRSLDLFEHVIALSSIDALWDNMIDEAPKLIVVDFWLPDGAALSLLKQLRERLPHTVLLVMSADDDRAIINKVQTAGANGFVHKQVAPERFAEALLTLMQGDFWFPTELPSQKNPLQKELSITAQELGLTPRQGEILVMIIQGLPNKRIANSLGLSEQTVKEHVSGILERLGVSNRMEIMTKLRGKRVD